MTIRVCTTIGFVLAMTAGTAMAQEADTELGKQEYFVACAGCHGESGKGTGPLAGILSIETPDLTTITKRTGGGEFPYRNTALLIDGRNDIRAHGGEMPIWGGRFMANIREEDSRYMTSDIAELLVKGRVLALVQYLESIQE